MVSTVVVFLASLLVWAQPTTVNNPLRLWVRSQAQLSSRHSLPGSPVEMIVVRDYVAPGVVTIPMGSKVKGKVLPAERKRHSALRLTFESVSIEGQDYPLKAHVGEVDNARERVEPDGTILGLDQLGKKPGKLELILLAAAYAHPAFLITAETTKYIIREVKQPEVHYQPGTDFALVIEELPKGPASSNEAPTPDPVAPDDLALVLAGLPTRTTTRNLSVPSDWTNIAFTGSRESLKQAFAAAGWSTAALLSLRSDAKVFFAVADHHSYKSAPVSTLLVDGREPDMVYQKQTNTFAKRHHIRIWLTNKTWSGQPIWIAAATHDIGIDFSFEAKTFAHRVDSDVDQERLKIIDDLRFSQKAQSFSYLARSSVTSPSKNATGDLIRTDGRLAFVVLAP